MFAFGLWDQKTRCLTLVKDRIGEKPYLFELSDEIFNKCTSHVVYIHESAARQI